MKKVLLAAAVFIFNSVFSQFNVKIITCPEFVSKEAILYTLDGSKSIIHGKDIRAGNSWNFKFTKPYSGILKLYFPDTNSSVNLIAENKDVSLSLKTKTTSISDITYLDEVNILMEKVEDLQNKNEQIFPALVQINELYSPQSPFGKALSQEIVRLGEDVKIDAAKNPFIYFYHTNYKKYTLQNSDGSQASPKEVIAFLSKANDYLETSSLMRPTLINYLNAAGNSNPGASADALLASVGVETPRGQTILSELIEIFGAYGMTALKEEYLEKGNNLKCTITDRLASTLKSNKNVQINATFPNNTFTRDVKKTTSKSIYDVKADKKIIMFWSSTCSHCEKDLPVILEKYKNLKALNIEVIGLSLDTDKKLFEDKVAILPWINDSELRGWNSTYSETYNISATPTYFVLDGNNKIIATPNSVSDLFMFLKIN